ncbi:hypothetical protein GCM10028819_44670 [Spirosoma humi]
MTTTNTTEPWQPLTTPGPASQWITGLDEQLTNAQPRADLSLPVGRGGWQTALTANSFWLLGLFGEGCNLAIRTCFDPQGLQTVTPGKQTATTISYQIDGSLGTFSVRVEWFEGVPALFRYTTSLEPRQPFSVQAFPRDLYLLDEKYRPAPEGMVYVAQDGPTSGLAYLTVTQPATGSLLYFQNLTALNDYCQSTGAEPGGSVAVQWPEAGFMLPVGTEPLPAGKAVVLSDAFLWLNDTRLDNEFMAADQFIEAMAGIYRQLPKPATTYYDWPKAAQKTIKALTESPDCGRTIKQHFYVNAYVDSTDKPPESMVQLAILVPLWEYQTWLGQPISLVEHLKSSMPQFYVQNMGTIVRWLPGEQFKKAEKSEEEDPKKIDSWYLLHSLMNLGRLAEKGNLDAKEMLFQSIDFVIQAAHHFDYNWPVFYDSRSLDVVKAETSEGKGGELDVAGLYTHVMLQTYELSKDQRYLNEATASAQRLRGKGFELLYQSNITMMSALSLVKLWRLTGNRLYRNLSQLSIANVLTRLWMWECNFGFGPGYSTFMGLGPLKGADYLAPYEEAEVIATMLAYLKEMGSDTSDAVRLLLSEYMKYLLHRGRFYFPTELPSEMISQQPREGRIQADLPIPLEDIPMGNKQAGSVGQEVYGGALAYILTTYAYKRFGEVPVVVFSEYPIGQSEYELMADGSGKAYYQLTGHTDIDCQVRLLARERHLPSELHLSDDDDLSGEPLRPLEQDNQQQVYQVRGNMRLRIDWHPKPRKNKS